MKITIQFDLDNAAFDGEAAGDEVARILGELSATFRYSGSIRPFKPMNIRDYNGNAIGTYKVTG